MTHYIMMTTLWSKYNAANETNHFLNRSMKATQQGCFVVAKNHLVDKIFNVFLLFRSSTTTLWVHALSFFRTVLIFSFITHFHTVHAGVSGWRCRKRLGLSITLLSDWVPAVPDREKAFSKLLLLKLLGLSERWDIFVLFLGCRLYTNMCTRWDSI